MDSKLIKKYFAGFIFGLICLVFVFFGLPQQMGVMGGGIVAEVNGEIVSLGEYQDMRQRFQQFQGFNLSQLSGQFRTMMQQRINQQAIDYLVNNILIYQAAEDAGLRVADAEIRDIIVGIGAFQDDGVFQPQLYKQYLKNTRKAAGDFEQDLRVEQQRIRMQRIVSQAIQATKQMEDLETKVRSKEFDVEYLEVSEANLNRTVKVADKEAKEKLTADAEFSKELQADYDQNKAKYVQEYEQVQARHILIKIDAGKKDGEAAALKKATSIKKELNDGNFAELAKKHSDDPGSAKKGGDLGFFPRGRMVKPFEDRAFTMKIDDISEPVKSQFGYHIIQVKQKKSADFESVKLDLAKKSMLAEKVSTAKKEIGEAVKAGKLTEAEKKFGLSWQATGVFDLGAERIPRLGDNDAIFEEILRLNKGEDKAQKLIDADGKKFVLRLKTVKPSAKVESDNIRETLSGQLMSEVNQEWTKQLRDAANFSINQRMIR